MLPSVFCKNQIALASQRHKLIAVMEELVSSPCLHPSPFHINTEIAALLGIVHIELMLPGMEVWLAVPVSLF